MVARESLVVVVSIEAAVKYVLGSKLLHHFVDVLHAFFALPHGLGRVVAVAAGTIPFWEKFRCVRDDHVEVLSHSSEQVSGHPEVISDFDAFGRPNLEFPLSWHDFSIGPADG